MTALTAIFSTVARPKLGGTKAMRSPPSRSKSASKGSMTASLSMASGLADAEVAVVALGYRFGVVGVREYGDPGGLWHVGLVEELLVVLEHVDALLRPLVLALRAALHYQHLGQAAARGQARPHGHHCAPDVLDGLHRPRGVGKDRVHRDRAVVGLGLALVGALGEHQRTPRPGEHGVGLEIPLVLLGRLDAEALGHRVQEAEAVHLLNRVH